MARLRVRNRAMHEFEIDESGLPFWEGRVEVIERIPETGEEPEPEQPGTTKPDKAASRSAKNKEE